MSTVEENKGQIKTRIWQSIAQSGVEVSAIPREQLDTLVDAIAEGVLVAIDDMLDEIGLPQRPSTADTVSGKQDGQEQVLWEGRPFLSLVENYVVTSERVRVVTGLIGKQREDIELVRVQDIDHTQGISERILNIGDIIIRSSDPSDPEIVLRNVRDPEHVHEVIRRAMLDARKRYRFSFQEEM